MSFEIKAEGVDVEAVLRAVRQRIEEKKKGLYDDDELHSLGERDLEPVVEAGDVPGGLLDELRDRDGQWNYSFDPETLYRSSRGVVGQALEAVRGLLRPVQKLFWNPNPMISALSRQSDLNRSHAHLLHNLVLELTRLNLEVQELKSRNLQLAARLELLARRGKTLESMVVYRDEPEREEPDRG
jgi:hypothetical protein